jgi:hypothetical protein
MPHAQHPSRRRRTATGENNDIPGPLVRLPHGIGLSVRHRRRCLDDSSARLGLGAADTPRSTAALKLLDSAKGLQMSQVSRRHGACRQKGRAPREPSSVLTAGVDWSVDRQVNTAKVGSPARPGSGSAPARHLRQRAGGARRRSAAAPRWECPPRSTAGARAATPLASFRAPIPRCRPCTAPAPPARGCCRRPAGSSP